MRGLATVLFAFTLACDISPSSETKSIENFAAGKLVNKNTCRGSYEHDLSRVSISSGNVVSRDNVTAALSAIPPKVMSLLGKHLTIKIVPDVASQCQNQLKDLERVILAEGEPSLDTCWQVSTSGDVELLFADRTIAPSITTVDHHLVRLVGRIYAQVYGLVVEAVGPDALPTDVKEDYAKFLLDKDNLAKSLILELSSQEQLAALKRLDTEKPGAFRTIADFAFAEAFDSFYCSKASRETASDLAPKSQELLAALMEEGPPPAGNPKNERLAGSAGIEKLLHLAQTMPDIEVGLSAAGAAAVLAKLRTSETVGFNLDWNSFYNWFNTTSSYAGPSYVSEFAGGAHAGAGIALTYPRIQERNQLLNGFYNGDAGRPSHDPRGAAFDRREQIYNSGSNPRVRAARYVGDNW